MNQMDMHRQLLVEAQEDNARLRRENSELRAETRQIRQQVEELQEIARHWQQAAQGMGPGDARVALDHSRFVWSDTYTHNGDGTYVWTLWPLDSASGEAR